MNRVLAGGVLAAGVASMLLGFDMPVVDAEEEKIPPCPCAGEKEMNRQAQRFVMNSMTPESWEVAKRKRAVKHVKKGKADVQSFMGGTNGLIRFEIDDKTLQEMLDGIEKEKSSFKLSQTEMKWNDKSWDEITTLQYQGNGVLCVVEWWKPREHKGTSWCRWASPPGERPRWWMYVKICDLQGRKSVVYVKYVNG